MCAQASSPALTGLTREPKTLPSSTFIYSFIHVHTPLELRHDGGTALHAAARRGHLAVARELCSARADPSLAVRGGSTPLRRETRQRSLATAAPTPASCAAPLSRARVPQSEEHAEQLKDARLAHTMEVTALQKALDFERASKAATEKKLEQTEALATTTIKRLQSEVR